MAGVNVSSGGGARRALDAEINAVPMVDLMMVTISFLLITAVWSHMSRLDAAASVPGEATPAPIETPRKVLDVEARADKFVISWKRGSETIDVVDVPNQPAPEGIRYPALAAKIEELWRAGGEHRDPADRGLDRAVVRVHDRMPYRELVGVMDAVQKTRRTIVHHGATSDVAAFELVMGK